MIRRIALILFFSVASVTLTFAQTNNDKQKTETEVRERLSQWVVALKRNDVAVLDQILADDFKYLLDNGTTRNKTEELAPSRAGDLKFESISVDEVKIFVYGDTAIATGIGNFKGSYKGRPFESRERFCDVYQKRRGQWRVIASRPVPLPMPKAG